MDKIYTAMGLMSGTSSDGVDVSIIKSDGNQEFSILATIVLISAMFSSLIILPVLIKIFKPKISNWKIKSIKIKMQICQ